MQVEMSLVFANLGTQASGQGSSLQALHALSDLMSSAEKLRNRRAPRKVTCSELIEICHNMCMRYQLQTTVGDTGIVCAAYQEVPSNMETGDLQSVWSAQGWGCTAAQSGSTVVMIAMKNVPTLDVTHISHEECGMPESISERSATLALFEAGRGPATRETRKAGIKCVIVSYHGVRHTNEGNLKELFEWMTSACKQLGAPVCVMGDFNIKWGKCNQALNEWNSGSAEPPIQQVAYLPHRRITLSDTPHENVIDYALIANGEHESSMACASLDARHRCMDMAETTRNGVIGMDHVLDRNFFDHDVVLHRARLET